MYIYIYIYTDMYIYIYIYRERESQFLAGCFCSFSGGAPWFGGIFTPRFRELGRGLNEISKELFVGKPALLRGVRARRNRRRFQELTAWEVAAEAWPDWCRRWPSAEPGRGKAWATFRERGNRVGRNRVGKDSCLFLAVHRRPSKSHTRLQRHSQEVPSRSYEARILRDSSMARSVTPHKTTKPGVKSNKAASKS